MGTSAWELFSQSESYHRTSSDASLFSSSLPVLAHKKFSLNQPKHDFPSGNKLGSDLRGNKSLKVGESHAVGSLLPDDEDELLDMSMDGFDIGWLPSLIDDSEEYDLFGSGGGLEMESDYQENLGVGISNLYLSDNGAGEGLPLSGLSNGVGAVAGEHPLGEHPSRTLFVRNINSNVEDAELRTLFEQYGDIRTLYTACKHRGFVMISYYDIRASRTAMKSLQNKSLRKRKLDIHFSIPKENPSDKDMNQGTLVAFNLDPSVTNDDLRLIFGAYGEVKEIRETPHKRHHKFIEFYDVRAAEAALKSLNRSDIAGKRIKLEPSRPGGARRSLLQHLNHDLEQDERNSHQVGSHGNSPPATWPLFGSPMERNSLQSFSKSPGFNSSFSKSPGFINSLSSSLGSSLSGLASVSRPQVPNQRVVPTGPEQMLGQFAGSSVRPFPGLHDFLGSPKLSAGLTNSAARIQTMRNPFLPTGSNGSPFPNLHGSFRSSSQHHHQYHFGSAPSGITPEQRVYGVGGSFGSANSHSTVSSAFVSRNSMDNGSPVFSVMSSPRHSPMFLGNGHFLGHATSNLQSLADRGWSRRVESNGIHMDDKKQFQLDLDKIRSGEDTRTTLMIKNIPNKYTSNMLLATIDEHHRGTYDFLYLPIDFKNKCNVGYAFINMLSPSNVICFYEAFNGKKWEKFNSEKIASLAFARIQGKAALIAHFQNSSLMNEDKRCRPILFTSESPEFNNKIIQENLPVYYSSLQPGQSSGSGPLNLSGSTLGRTSGDQADKR